MARFTSTDVCSKLYFAPSPHNSNGTGICGNYDMTMTAVYVLVCVSVPLYPTRQVCVCIKAPSSRNNSEADPMRRIGIKKPELGSPTSASESQQRPWESSPPA